jgi:hypothetical protein
MASAEERALRATLNFLKIIELRIQEIHRQNVATAMESDHIENLLCQINGYIVEISEEKKNLQANPTEFEMLYGHGAMIERYKVRFSSLVYVLEVVVRKIEIRRGLISLEF